MPHFPKPNRLIRSAKNLIPSRDMDLPIVAGPFRGARFHANPRTSLRRVFGLYESELNPWLTRALKRADLVLDVGANDGYFTFGCASAMARASTPVRVIGFEPVPIHVEQLEAARHQQRFTDEQVTIVPKMVGNEEGEGITRLDSLFDKFGTSKRPMIKIDVEGAEIDVLEGADRWIRADTMLLIEVHKREYLDQIRSMLAGRTAPMVQVDQRAHPLLGREQRDLDNWWLVSSLD